MPARPFTRAQAAQNAAFLRRLGETGNARLAARELGLNRSTFTKRRAKHAAFAQAWDAALAAAHAKLTLSGGPRLADIPNPPAVPGPKHGRAKGGEPAVVRRIGGKLQVRLAKPGWLTKAGEAAFLRALSATANVRLSAAAAGVAHTTIYRHRAQDAAFRREMRLALERGYDRLEFAMLGATDPGSWTDDAWDREDPLPIPPMTVSQALFLHVAHKKAVRDFHEEPHRRKRRNETSAQYGFRLGLMWRAEQRRAAEDRARDRAARFEGTGDWRLPGEPLPVAPLPPLDEVMGWSKADADKVPHNPNVPLFGGWRIGDWEKRGRR